MSDDELDFDDPEELAAYLAFLEDMEEVGLLDVEDDTLDPWDE